LKKIIFATVVKPDGPDQLVYRLVYSSNTITNEYVTFLIANPSITMMAHSSSSSSSTQHTNSPTT